ncbi:hypothetical protein KUTeg_005364 [Tegillarca granosa]|uniref:Uncharacterized protein n=1 Tax=Tegillarca granosa TaxID=220873 RepID=A0ABQ9FP12_TEGGR|nr:hypothetical protein KUTeg_005364 [Tegillarca granosa]
MVAYTSSIVLVLILTGCGCSHAFWLTDVMMVYLESNKVSTSGSNTANYDVGYLVSNSSVDSSAINTAKYVPYLVTATGQEVSVVSYSVASGPIESNSLITFEQIAQAYNTTASPDVVKFYLTVSNSGNSSAYGGYVNVDLTSGMDIDYGTIMGSDYLGPLNAQLALLRGDSYTSNLFYQHGFTALTFFMSLLLGMVLVAVGIFIFMVIRRRQRNRTTEPSGINEKQILREKGTVLMMDPNASMGHTIIDYSLDIVTTVKTDIGIEEQRNESSINALILVIQGLKHNKDITQTAEEVVINNFKKKKVQLDHDMDEEYKREMKKLYKKLSAKNKAIMSRKLQKHRESKKQLVSESGHLGDNEFAIRKRMELKELEQNTIDELQGQGKLSQEKVDWLIKEHKNTQNKLEKLYDEEISRQRMLLEEKLERRKALAKASEQQEDDHSDLLNTIAGQQVSLIQRAKKQGVISDATANELIEKIKEEMITLKEKLDKDKEKQEAELQKKLSALKRQRLADKKKQHEADLADYEKTHQSQQTDGPIDPVHYMEGKLKLQSQQRREMYDMENEVDEDHAEELRSLREDMVEQTKEQLHIKEDQLVNRLQQEGMTESKIRTLLNQHENQVKKLQEEQQKSRQEQERVLKEKLAKNRQEWARRKEAEKAEQQELREHENKIINLTLNKLKQKRMLEEKLAHKRTQQMMLLQQKHTKETEENNGEESDPESQVEVLNLLKKQAEQRMAILQGNKLDLEDEMESVRIEMLKERALALRDQEERLGAMVASLQVSKAREMAKIEEQQKAINNLKANLMDDLNARGILSDPECQAILQRHKDSQDEVNQRIEAQRSKQEKMLKQRLKDRLDQREKSMLEAQDIEIQRIMGSSKNKTAVKIKKMLIIHKHMVEMEKLRNTLDREVAQVLEDVKQQYEVKRMQALQEQELEFVAGLIRVGAFHQNDVMGVLQVLFPTKSDKQLKDIMSKIYDPKQTPSKNVEEEKSAPVKKPRKKRPQPAIPVYSDDDETVIHTKNEEYTYLDARPEPIGEVVEAQPIEGFNDRNELSPLYLKPLKQQQPRLPPIDTLPPPEAPTGKKKKKNKLLKKLAHETHDQGYYDEELL